MSEAIRRDFDAVVVGAGPNGLAAAIRLRQAGLSVLVLEAKDQVGGGARSAELMLPGFVHDICSAIHPLAVVSPFFSSLPLASHGLEYVYPPVAAAHPFDDGSASALYRSLEETAVRLGPGQEEYLNMMRPLVAEWPRIANDVLGPLRFPDKPGPYARFGLSAVTSADFFSRKFPTLQGKGFWGGMAAHSMQPLSNLTTAAVGLVLLITGHITGWPFPRGGAGQLSRALSLYLESLGGKIETNAEVHSLAQLPSARAVLFDVTPRQLLRIAGHKFSSFYQWQLRRYRYGVGVFKVDWALDGPVPFVADACRHAGTVHLGNTYKEIAMAERMVWRGEHPERPFVLFAQQSLFDPARAPRGKQVAWAYCHVPHGSTVDMTDRIERQVERFAPGFRDRIIARHTMNTAGMEAYNANYVGGDINGGVGDVGQLFTRPALRSSPYRTSAKGIYICSSATPPGGGVHGMCGVHAAERALRDVFGLRLENKF